jgi:hypothetical protein
MNNINIGVKTHLHIINGIDTSNVNIIDDINITTKSIFINGSFNHEKKVDLTFADSNGDVPKSVDDIATITFSIKTTFENERCIKNKIKNDVLYLIQKRQNDIDFLEKDREIINKKIVNIETSKNDIREHYKEIELINDQIRNHYEEIDRIKESLTTKIEVGDQINEYEFKLEQNHMQCIDGLADQKKQFSIFWFMTKDIRSTTNPTNVTLNNTKTLQVSYDTIMNNLSN